MLLTFDGSPVKGLIIDQLVGVLVKALENKRDSTDDLLQYVRQETSRTTCLKSNNTVVYNE